MAEVFRITQPKIFSLEEAEKLLPLIRKITKEAALQYVVLEERMRRLEKESQLLKEAEDQVGDLLTRWSEKVLKLGCHPKGIWLVDFDNGSGFYCWRYDEDRIEYFHGYEEGFSGRTAIN